ncbi:hypothetical protein [Furfurilactobacillus siliginis]|nr:hypothetical protein [Furfurilactobacillus siliginis]
MMDKDKLYRSLWYIAGTIFGIGMLDVVAHGIGIMLYAGLNM